MGKIIESILKTKGIEYLASEDIKNIDTKYASEAVCIDFTTPVAFKENYKFIAENFKAAVIGTTGWSDIKNDIFSYAGNERNVNKVYYDEEFGIIKYIEVKGRIWLLQN